MSRFKANVNLQNSIDELVESINILKETVITQSNIMEVSELKKNVDALKEIVDNQKNAIDVSNRQIKDLKETVVNQNKIIVGLVSDLKIMLKSTLIPGQVSTKYSDLFPVQSEDELREIEEDINDDTKFAMVATIRSILTPGGLNKNLINLLHIKMMLQFNVDGKQEKKRLLDFPKFVNAIYKALIADGLSKTFFLNDLRTAFRLSKNRYYKKKSVNKQSKKNDTFFNIDSESDAENISPEVEPQTSKTTTPENRSSEITAKTLTLEQF